MWLVKQFGVALPIAWGPSFLLPLLPEPHPLDVCMGEPIPVPKSAADEPTSEEIDRVHAKYLAAIQSVFDRNKAKYGCKDKTLKIT